jgi:hypothetical protein
LPSTASARPLSRSLSLQNSLAADVVERQSNFIERSKMHCSAKTMIKVAVALGAVLTVAYVAFPEARTAVLASAPFLLALACPIAMIAMLFMMKGTSAEKKDAAAPTTHERPKRDASPPEPRPNVTVDEA